MAKKNPSSAESGKRRSKSSSSRGKAFKNGKSRSKLYAVLGIGILLLGGYAIYSFERARTTKLNAKKSNAVELPKGGSTFDDFLVRADQVELINLSNELWQTRGIELPSQIEAIQKRIKIADRLLDIPDDADAHRYAINSKLDVMTLWSTLNVKYELNDDALEDRLKALANENINNVDSVIAMKARMSLTLTAVNKYLFKPSDDGFELVKTPFWAASESSHDNAQMAKSLYKTAVLIRKARHLSQAIELFEKLRLEFGKSEDPQFKVVADAAYEELVFTEFDLTYLVQGVLEGDKQAASQFFEHAATLLESNKLTLAGFRRLFGMVEAVMGSGEIDRSRELVKKLEDSLGETRPDSEESAEATLNMLHNMVARYESIGKLFAFDGLMLPSGLPFDSSILDNSFVAIIYWDPSSKEAVTQLMELFQYSVAYKQVGLKVLAVTPSGVFDEQGKNELARYQNEVPEIVFVKADLESASGKEFLQRFPIAFVPYVVLLDRNHKMEILNPTTMQINNRLNALHTRPPLGD